MNVLRSTGARTAIGSLALCAAIAVVGCKSSSSKPAEPAPAAAGTTNSGLPGGVELVSATTSFTIQAIDAANRTVTLKNEGGAVVTYKAGPMVRNFDQLRVGNVVRATVTSKLAIGVRRTTDAQPGVVVTQAVVRAPKGGTPGGTIVDTVEITSTLTAVDAAKHTVTLQGKSGDQETFSVDPSVDLSKVKVGDMVVVRYAEALAITVEPGTATK